MSEIHVTGLADLQKFLDQLPKKLEANVVRGSLRAGAMVVLKQAKSNVPVGKPNAENVRLYGGYAGALRDSIRVSTKIKGGKVIASVKAGGKTKKGADAFYAQMVEYGTSAHIIKAKPGKFMSIGGGYLRQVEHPGTRARPFLRPALDSQAGAAIAAAAEYMKHRLSTKEGMNTADVEIEVEES